MCIENKTNFRSETKLYSMSEMNPILTVWVTFRRFGEKVKLRRTARPPLVESVVIFDERSES